MAGGERRRASVRARWHSAVGMRGRLGELPKDKEIIAFCQISLRGYEAEIILRAAGFRNVRVMDGGVAMWPFDKIHG